MFGLARVRCHPERAVIPREARDFLLRMVCAKFWHMPSKLTLETIGVPPATSRVVTFFARNPTARPAVRELQRTLGIASASAQRDLERLTTVGALRVVRDGTMLRYSLVMESPLWRAVRIILNGEAPRPSTVRERARRYGVDIGQLQSALRLTVEERIRRLDADATFLRAARAGRGAAP